MGKPSSIRSFRRLLLHTLLLALVAWLASLPVAAQSTRATAVPLLLPAGLVYDTSGNLYLAEATGNQILRVSPTGILTTYAGTGTQGFAGDGGPALAALLDTPTALAISPAGDLYLADSHNHRIRRVDHTSGLITTVAGTGTPGSSPDGTLATAAQLDLPAALAFDAAGDLVFADARTHRIRRIDHTSGLVTTLAGSGTQGFSGDSGPALAAALDTPSGLAFDAAGDLFLTDAHNQRIRRVDASTQVISTVAGIGTPAFSGDANAAVTAALHLPRGLTVDAAGDLYLSDSANHRIRRIDASTGTIATVAGGLTQAFAGDNAPAVNASLDSPTALTQTPSGLVTLADAHNGRVRQIDSAAVIHTVAGLGTTLGASLNLTAPSTVLYGSSTVTLTAALATSPATGSVTFLDDTGTQPVTLATVVLAANVAQFGTATLAAGPHSLSATYPGDNLHSAAQSQLLALTVAPASAAASPNSISLFYGQPIPTLTGTLTGILPQDIATASLMLTTSASPNSTPAAYPISAALAGPAAANYILTVTPATVTITQAPSATTLTTSNLSVQVSSSTSGIPTGIVTLVDGSTSVASAALVAGSATFAATLATGSHTLTARYPGDLDFLPSTSAASVVTVGSSVTPDFSLAATGQTTVTVPAGSAASFSFAVTPVNGTLASAVQLTASGLPANASASFNPAYLPPSANPSAFILTIQTPHAALPPLSPSPFSLAWALLLPLPLLLRRPRTAGKLLGIIAVTWTILATTACGDRINTSAQTAAAHSYTITVTGTATSSTGAILQHSAPVTLTVQ